MPEELKIVVDSLALLLAEKARETSDPNIHAQATSYRRKVLALLKPEQRLVETEVEKAEE